MEFKISRLHQRTLFTLGEEGWEKVYLQP